MGSKLVNKKGVGDHVPCEYDFCMESCRFLEEKPDSIHIQFFYLSSQYKTRGSPHFLSLMSSISIFLFLKEVAFQYLKHTFIPIQKFILTS